MYAQQAQALITLVFAYYRRIIKRLTYGTKISERNILDDELLCYYYVIIMLGLISRQKIQTLAF